MLYYKKLAINAFPPTMSHPGEDLGFDLYAYENIALIRNQVVKVPTGIAMQYSQHDGRLFGFLLKDRSSMASKGITVSGGVIDAGYTGEMTVMLTYNGPDLEYFLYPGDKIIQAVPIETPAYGGIQEVVELVAYKRGSRGFGSSGR